MKYNFNVILCNSYDTKLRTVPMSHQMKLSNRVQLADYEDIYTQLHNALTCTVVYTSHTLLLFIAEYCSIVAPLCDICCTVCFRIANTRRT